MSSDEFKIKNSRRRQKDENACRRQAKLAELSGLQEKDFGSKHRFNKHHALNCGNPKCIMCSNPRKTFNEITIQEKRMYQDMDGNE
jgi:hypothetical protein